MGRQLLHMHGEPNGIKTEAAPLNCETPVKAVQSIALNAKAAWHRPSNLSRSTDPEGRKGVPELPDKEEWIVGDGRRLQLPRHRSPPSRTRAPTLVHMLNPSVHEDVHAHAHARPHIVRAVFE